MLLVKKDASRIKFRSFTIAEMIFSMVLMSIFMVMSAPLISLRDKLQGQDLSSIMCVKNELASNSSENISASACPPTSTNPCCLSVKSCRYDQNNACPTLANYADNGVGNETISGKKVLGAVCDQGGRKGCRYFAVSCVKDNTTCSNSTNNYNLQYYLNLPMNSTNTGRLPILDITKSLYNDGSPNVAYWINNTCSQSSSSAACYVEGLPADPSCGAVVICSLRVSLCNNYTAACYPDYPTSCSGTGCSNKQTCNYSQAVQACAAMNKGVNYGAKNWRLPTDTELSAWRVTPGSSSNITAAGLTSDICDFTYGTYTPGCTSVQSCSGSPGNWCDPYAMWTSNTSSWYLQSRMWYVTYGQDPAYAFSARCVRNN